MTSDPTLAYDVAAVCRLTGACMHRSGQAASEYLDEYLVVRAVLTTAHRGVARHS